MGVQMVNYGGNQTCFLHKNAKVQGGVFRVPEKDRCYDITKISLQFAPEGRRNTGNPSKGTREDAGNFVCSEMTTNEFQLP